jgi:hypothetical protein
MKFSWLPISAVSVLLCLPASASTFRAINGVEVLPVNKSEIEVFSRRSPPKEQYWCAAADFLRRQGLPWKTRVYVAQGYARGKVSGVPSTVTFTIDPVASGVTPYENNLITDLFTVGYSKSLTGAWKYCRKVITPFRL